MATARKNKVRVALHFSPKYEPLWRDIEGVRYYVITGGRGSGKSFAASSNLCCRFMAGRKNTLYLRQTMVSASISIIPEFMGKLNMLGYGGMAKTTKREIQNARNGAYLYFRGIKAGTKTDEGNLKSIPNVGDIYIDEAQEVVDEDAFDRLDLSLRDSEVKNRVTLILNPPDTGHWIYRRFFETPGVDDDFNGVVGDTCYIHTTWEDNVANLSADFIRLAETCRATDLIKYDNIFGGRWRRDNSNALWKMATMIEPYRSFAATHRDLERVVVAVDPAVTSREGSDLTGIVAAGRRRVNGEMHYYILGDWSVSATPMEWAKVVTNKYTELEADRVVAEVNQGGDLVEATLRNSDRHVSYRPVRATRGKILRAEPIAELYERGLVHHVGRFPELERQMCEYCGFEKEKSPDRLDALVWALTELSGRGQGGGPILA